MFTEFGRGEEIDVETVVEQLKNDLICRATGKACDNAHYVMARKRLLANKDITHLIPQFVKTYRSLDEFWIYIKPKFGSYAERTQYLINEFLPIQEFYENRGKDEITQYANSDIFTIGERIGNGGYGVIYKYHHSLADVDFAIKVLDPSFIPEEEKEDYNTRFFREAKILFSLDHPNIVRIYDVGMLQTKPQKPFIRMEYIKGENLEECISRLGPVSFERSIKPIKALLEGLSYAHKKGIIHRDLKPRNFMVSVDGNFKIIDFGISAYLESELHTKLTKPGEPIAGGKYIDPELEQKPDLRDVRSDIYSVGAIWYFIITGHSPAGSDIRFSLIDTKRISELQANIILKCLARDITRRYLSCDEVLSIIAPINSPKTVSSLTINRITEVTRQDLKDLFIERLEYDFDEYIHNRMSEMRQPEKVFYYYGRLEEIEFLEKLYDLSEMPGSSSSYRSFKDEIIKHTVANEDWKTFWIFSDKRLGLSEGNDETLLRFLSFIFHPLVRNEKCDWHSMLNSINSILANDGYELFESERISNKSVYSYRPIM